MTDKRKRGFWGTLKCLVGLHDWGSLSTQTSTHCIRCGTAARPRTYQCGNIVLGDLAGGDIVKPNDKVEFSERSEASER